MTALNLCLHKGCRVVSLEDLAAIPMPERTKSYQPYGHADFVNEVKSAAEDILMPKDYTFLQSQIGASKDGQKMFGILKFQGKDEELALAIGIRNSYDRTMAAGLCFGASVFVCDNMCFNGDITVMRKHTVNVIASVRADLRFALERSAHGFDSIRKMADALKTRLLTQDEGYEFLGWLFGQNVYGPTINNEAYRGWQEPYYDAFKPRNAWSLYNAVTDALKRLHPAEAMAVHVDIGNRFMSQFAVQ